LLIIVDYRATIGGKTPLPPSLAYAADRYCDTADSRVVRNSAGIGHTRLTHSYLLSGANQPERSTYQCPLAFRHIFVERTDFNDARNK